LKYLVFLLVVGLLAGCSRIPGVLEKEQPFKAIYLVQGQGELSTEELKAHPDVLVTGWFDFLKEYAADPVAFWIDKNAVELVDNEWLNQPPQKYYPVVLVGYNDWLYSFRDQLDLFGIHGPYVDWSKETLEPGFSVGMYTKDEPNGEHSAISQSHLEVATVENLLAITNELLPKSLAK
jgi:hypothetical protein